LNAQPLESASTNVTNDESTGHHRTTTLYFELLRRPESKNAPLGPTSKHKVDERLTPIHGVAFETQANDLVLEGLRQDRMLCIVCLM